MKAFLKKFAPFLIVFAFIAFTSGVFPVEHALAQTAPAPSQQDSSSVLGSAASWVGGWALDLVLFLPGWLANMALWIASWLTWASGVLLNLVIKFTVVDMSENLSNAAAINDAWRVIRDVANISFIFVLLYAAIKTILGMDKDVNRVIVRVIVVAVLINFSLFATKVVIDVSNVLALTFYDAIAPGVIASGDTIDGGISNSIMERLNIGSLWANQGSFDGSKLVLVGVIGTIFAFIASFVFLSVSIMFIMRFVILIFVLILSPLAFVSFILPKADSMRNKWMDALIGQAFFAPIYFMLTWVVILVSRGLFTNDGNLATAIIGNVGNDTNSASSDLSVIMNFMIMVGMLLTSLSIAKEWAGKAGPQASKATAWLTAGAGMAAIGGLGALGRNSIGRAGNFASNLQGLQNAAAKDGMPGAMARLGLYAAKKARSGSFDMRNASVPTGALGDGVGALAGSLGGLKDTGRNRFTRTLGRAGAGIASTLEEPGTIPNIEFGQMASAEAGLGKASDKGYREVQKDKKKAVDEARKDAEDERQTVNDRTNILNNVDGADAAHEASLRIKAAKGENKPVDPADQAIVDAHETEVNQLSRTLASMSEKEIVTMVQENRKLLDSMTFANNLSSKQLEALNKSTELSEEEKDRVKGNRFDSIIEGIKASAKDPADRDRDEQAAAQLLGGNIRGMSDDEIEMFESIMPEYFTNKDFVSNLKATQVEFIGKNNKFSKQQRDSFNKERRAPLVEAIKARGMPGAVAGAVGKAAGKLNNAKDLLGLLKTKIEGTDDIIGLDDEVLSVYTPQLLTRMVGDMDANDIEKLRTKLLKYEDTNGKDPSGKQMVLERTIKWLTGDNTSGIFA